MAKTNSVAGMLGRAAEIGQQIETIAGDVQLQRLSRPAWVRKCLELGGFADVAALEAARAKLASTPYLDSEVKIRGEIWARNGQDQPAEWAGFSDGRGERAASYAERITLPMTVAEVSAISAYITAELRTDAEFGRLNDHGEVAAMLDPLAAELRELDQVLAREVRVADLAWINGRGTVRAGGVPVVLDEGSSARLASAIAETVRDRLRAGLQLAA